ncbi:peptidase U32 family protein [Alistipes sp.]|uniref:peptidase U32 family protein n=1 Tax=Alistipes sp. TaxID=1872444 RepID=UPI003A85343E
MKRLELLAPARDYESAVAAVDAGADAIYIGGARFGARHAAANTADDIRRAAEYAHLYGVRVHAALNTLLYDDELADAGRQARELIAVGVDALIVQDMALRRMALPVELHASTQTAIRTPAEAVFLARAGFARVILERALSLDEIRAICRATTAEVECFVHGAICVGYSGQCYLSRSMSARSGNRGECSQPCRLSYDLEDAAGRRILRGKHLLSVRDLNLSDRLGELIDAGVTSFKIEGRLKDTCYIRNVVAYYRQRLDEAIAARSDCRRASVGESRPDFAPDPSKSFTRGESEYFLAGRSAGVASFDTPKSVGEFVGRVAACDARGFTLDRDAALGAGDGLCIGADGTNVNSVEGRRVVPNRMPAAIRRGAAVYRNLDSRFRLQVERSRMRRAIPATACVTVTPERATVRYTDCEGLSAEASREGRFEPAGDPAKMADLLRTQAARSGDTPFEVRRVEVAGAERFVPLSLIGVLRREALEALRRVRAARVPERRILPEELHAPCPAAVLSAEANVTNRLAERFYRDHGVVRIERGLDLEASTAGRRVMRSAYCIRREIGECLRDGSRIQGDLFLVRGTKRYRLAFDCAHCEMSLTDER